MSQGFGYPAFPVDTHIHRLAQRWGLTNGKNVIQTEKDLKLFFLRKIGINFIFKLFGMVESIAKPGVVLVYLAKSVKAVTQIEKRNI